MRIHKRLLTISGTFLAVSAILFAITPHKASAAPVTIPVGGSSTQVTAAVCQFTSNGVQKIRAVVSKPAIYLNPLAGLRSYSQVPGAAWYTSTSNAWWGGVVTVMEVPAVNWYDVSFTVANLGGSGYTTFTSGYIATVYTPYC